MNLHSGRRRISVLISICFILQMDFAQLLYTAITPIDSVKMDWTTLEKTGLKISFEHRDRAYWDVTSQLFEQIRNMISFPELLTHNDQSFDLTRRLM